MWVPFGTFGEIKGRVRGVSLPYPNGQVLVWTDHGLFSIWYFRSAFITSTPGAEEHFDDATGAITWNGAAYPMLGPCAPGNDPRAYTRHPNGDRVALDPDTDAVHVLDAAGAVQQTIEGVRASDGWAVAAFSTDGKALVVADSASVRVFRYEAATGDERPRWAAVASADNQNRLLRAILSNPDEDTPRLMYADWLDEHDDPARAEFIRLQCRLAEREREKVVPATDPDQQRGRELLLQLGERWLAELPAIRGVRWAGFRRGFPGVSVTSATTLVSAAPKVWAAAPVEWVTITGLNANGARILADSDVFSRLRVLAIESYYVPSEGEKPLRVLLQSPRLSALRRLHLSAGAGEAGVIAAAQNPHLASLEWLAVGSGGLTDAAVGELLVSAPFQNLRGGSFVSHRLSAVVRKRLQARFPNATA